MQTAIIDPDNGGGTDYLSLNAWEAALPATLTDDEEATCRSSSGSADTTAFSVNITSVATYTLEIEPIAGNEASTSYSTSKYRLELGAGGDFLIYDSITVNNIQIGPTDDDGLRVLDTVGGDVWVKKCLFRGHATAYQRGLWVSSNVAGNDIYIYNNIIYKMSGTDSEAIEANAGTVYIENNTLPGNVAGIRASSGTVIAINNIVDGSGDTNAYIGTFASSDYNCTDGTDTGDGGANSIQSGTIVFTNTGAGTEDYSTTVDSTDTIEKGTDTVNGGYTDDIDGTARGNVWDIGAFNFQAEEGLSIPVAFHHLTKNIGV